MQTETYSLVDPNRPTILKDPDAVLDYTWDWTAWLAGISDVIAGTPTINVGAGGSLALQGAVVVVAGVVTAFLKGGTPGLLESATCRIVTAGGRTEDRTIYLRIQQR